MQLGFYFDQSRCTGCLACCVACKDWHDIAPGPVHWIRITCAEKGKFPSLFIAYLIDCCFHCLHPLCIEACPVQAIEKQSDNGIVVVDQEVCLGKNACGLCEEACPYGSPQFENGEDSKMQKCDFCAERWLEGKKPVCVEACPMRALDAGPLEQLKAKYGGQKETFGFTYFAELGPSIIFRHKNMPEIAA